MSTPYIPVARKHAVIGCMIRPNTTPGGFTHKFAEQRQRRRLTGGSISCAELREAANRVLERRGIASGPGVDFRRY